jgi:NodT family efflux transporter outer membrane factor (OMF) lipoprotein
MKPFKYITAGTLLLVILAGCKVSKDIATPTDAAPVQFRGASNGTADTLSMANLPYKDFFREKMIRDLIDTALVRNYDMQIALKNIESASILFKQSKWGNVPQLNLNVSASSNRPSDNSLNGLQIGQVSDVRHIEDYNASVGLSWEADIWRKIANQKNAAGANYLQSTEARKAVQTRLAADVAHSFYRLIMLDTQIGIARKNLALNDSTLTIIKLQFDAGQVTSLAVQQAEAQQLRAAEIITQLEQSITLEENALSILTGSFPKGIARTGKLEDIALQGETGTGIPADLLAQRPDVRMAELELTKANARTGITKASMYPSLVITANGGLNTFTASNWFNIPASLFGVVGAGLTQPLLQRKQLRTQYELALVDRERTVLEFRATVLQAVGEVSDELGRIDRLKQQYAIAENRVKVLQSGLKNANLLFKSGMANYLEVITAQSNTLQSELELAEIKTAQLNAGVELYRALGGGWR